MIKISIFLVAVSMPFTYRAPESNSIHTACVSMLGHGFNLLKTYHIKPALRGSEFSYVFTRGAQYKIAACDHAGNPMVITILDSNRNKVASNKVDGSIIPVILFPCQNGGIYYIVFSTKEGEVGCGSGAIGFKVDNAR
jgi:hypothetical protein